MINTSTKEFMKKTQEYILNNFNYTIEGLRADVNAAEWNCRWTRQKAIRFIEGGGLDCYYFQCADTLADLFNVSINDIWAYYKDDNQKLWESYIDIMSKNITCMVDGVRCYIK